MTRRTAEWLLFCVTIVASAGWLFTKNALTEFTPYTFLAIRFLLASIVLLIFCWSSLRTLDSGQVAKAIGTGAILAVSLLVWVLGIHQTASIGEGSFIVSLTVVFVPLVGRVLFGDKLEPRLLLALIPAIAGLALLALKNGLTVETPQLLFLTSTVGFAIHVSLTGRYVQKMPALPMASIQLAVVGVMAALVAMMLEGWEVNVSNSAWGWLICSAIIATSLRFALQTRALQFVDATHAGMIFILEPVWTAGLGALFLMERMTAMQMLGCVLIFMALITYRASWLFEIVAKLRK